MDSKDMEAINSLSESAGEQMKVDASFFSDKPTNDKNDNNEPSLDDLAKSLEDQQKELSIEEKMERLGITKDQAIDYIMQLSDNGYVEDSVSIFSGKFKAVFRTAKISDTRKFVEMFDELDINTQSKAEYFLNLYSLASILIKYNDINLVENDIHERAKWIEDNLPVPIYKALLVEATKFHAKIELLGSEEVADFF